MMRIKTKITLIFKKKMIKKKKNESTIRGLYDEKYLHIFLYAKFNVLIKISPQRWTFFVNSNLSLDVRKKKRVFFLFNFFCIFRIYIEME